MNDFKDKLLIIDDNPQALKKYYQIFSSHFLCLTSSSGEQGLQVFMQENPGVILCDVKMPGGISGFEVCKEVKSSSPQTIVMLITSYNNSRDRLTGYKFRADEYIDKNTNEEEVLLKVKNVYCTIKKIPAKFEPSRKNNELDDFESRARGFIHDFYIKKSRAGNNEPLTIELFAKEIYRGKRALQRDFINKVGCTFSDFHRQVRLEVACSWLIDTEKPISDIAEDLSFATPSIFARTFKKVYTITPSKYRFDYKK